MTATADPGRTGSTPDPVVMPVSTTTTTRSAARSVTLYTTSTSTTRGRGQGTDRTERPSGGRGQYKPPLRRVPSRGYTPPSGRRSPYWGEYSPRRDYRDYEPERLARPSGEYRETDRFARSPRAYDGRRTPHQPPPQPSRPLAGRVTGRQQPSTALPTPRLRSQRPPPQPWPRPQPVPDVPVGLMVMEPLPRPSTAQPIPQDRDQIFCENCERKHDPRFCRGPLARGALRVCTRCGSTGHRFERCWWRPPTADIANLDEHL